MEGSSRLSRPARRQRTHRRRHSLSGGEDLTGPARTRYPSRSTSRTSRCSRVSIISDQQSQAETSEAVQQILQHANGRLILDMVKQLNNVPGTRIDIADIARQLRPSAPPEDHVEVQARLRRDLFDIETTEKTLQRKLLDPPPHHLLQGHIP
jgi:hypothetical protein